MSTKISITLIIDTIPCSIFGSDQLTCEFNLVNFKRNNVQNSIQNFTPIFITIILKNRCKSHHALSISECSIRVAQINLTALIECLTVLLEYINLLV